MPAKSKSQQRLFGMLHAYNSGELHAGRSLRRRLEEMSRHISDEDVRHFAETPHEGLPEKKASSRMDRFRQYRDIPFPARSGTISKTAQVYGYTGPGSQSAAAAAASSGSGRRPAISAGLGRELGIMRDVVTDGRTWSDVGENMKRIGTTAMDNLGSIGVRLAQGAGHLNPYFWFNSGARRDWNKSNQRIVDGISDYWHGFHGQYHDRSLEGGINQKAVNFAGNAVTAAVTAPMAGRVLDAAGKLGVGGLPTAARAAGVSGRAADVIGAVSRVGGHVGRAGAYFPVLDKTLGLTEPEAGDSRFTRSVKEGVRYAAPRLAFMSPGSLAASRTVMQTQPVYDAVEAAAGSLVNSAYNNYYDDPAKAAKLRDAVSDWWNSPAEDVSLDRVTQAASSVVPYANAVRRWAGLAPSAQSLASVDMDADRVTAAAGRGALTAARDIASRQSSAMRRYAIASALAARPAAGLLRVPGT